MTDPTTETAPQDTSWLGLIKATGEAFAEDGCPRMAAALSYFTAFSLGPMLVLVIMIAGLVFGQGAIEGTLTEQLTGALGEQGAEQVTTMLSRVKERSATGGNVGATLLSLVGLLFGATGAFGELQTSINRIWRVAPDPDRGGIKGFVAKRLLSFSMIVVIALLLLTLLASSAILATFGEVLTPYLPGSVAAPLWMGVDVLVSLVLALGLFTTIFRVLPDARVPWRDVMIGAAVTTALFALGKTGLSVYLGRSSVASAFGAAGSLALVLVWVYYSAMILLLGAQFTRAWVARQGRVIEPSPGAVRIVESRTLVRPGDNDTTPSTPT